jgi:predicted DNA-binding transcriptional regulator AlpA
MQTMHSTAAREAASIAKSGIVPESISKFIHLPDSALIGAAAVCSLVGDVTRVTLWRWVRAGSFPAPRKLPGGRINAWKVGDVRRFLDQEASHVATS